MDSQTLWYFVGGFIGLVVIIYFSMARRKANAGNSTVMQAPATRSIGRDGIIINAGSKNLPYAQRRRRAGLITCYVGQNGSAKSATAVYDILPDLARGYKVLSTVALLAPEKAATEEEAEAAWAAYECLDIRPTDLLRLPHPQWVPLRSFRQMLTFEGPGVIFLDEVQGVADARDTMGLPPEIRSFFYQIRRKDIRMVWTTIDWLAADKRLRQATQIITLCRGYMPKFEPDKIWGTRRIFWLRTYDAKGFDDFTEARNRVNEKNKPRPVARQFVRLFGGLKHAINSYDSSAPVLSLGASSESGMCLTCNGKRRVKPCTCADHGGEVRPRARKPKPPTGGAAAGSEAVPGRLAPGVENVSASGVDIDGDASYEADLRESFPEVSDTDSLEPLTRAELRRMNRRPKDWFAVAGG